MVSAGRGARGGQRPGGRARTAQNRPEAARGPGSARLRPRPRGGGPASCPCPASGSRRPDPCPWPSGDSRGRDDHHGRRQGLRAGWTPGEGSALDLTDKIKVRTCVKRPEPEDGSSRGGAGVGQRRARPGSDKRPESVRVGASSRRGDGTVPACSAPSAQIGAASSACRRPCRGAGATRGPVGRTGAG